MSGGGISSPTRSRHQASRSITERVGSSKPTISSSSHHQHHHHITGHIPPSLQRRDRSRDARNNNMVMPRSALPITPRASLEASRSEGGMPGSPGPVHSRTGSLLVPSGNDVLGAKPVACVSREDQMIKEARKTEIRSAGFKNSIADLANLSTTTTRHLEETYYSVLEKLTTLQNTVVALKDIAHASATANDGFITEAHNVLAEAQSQLDGFGDFAEQQARVQALQDRVHRGRGRLSALSTRVDAVRQRVEKWERADREWQETTRRRLKIMWGVLFGAGLLLLILYWGTRAYAPRIEEVVVGDLHREALPAKTRLEGEAVEVGLGKTVIRENGSLPSLNFSRGGTAAGENVLQALDEL